jgi:endonuclease/exonuclease/phosphatase family metal-dependent hydrolase
LEHRRHLVQNLAGFGKLSELHSSLFYSDRCREIEQVLTIPEVYSHPDPIPNLRDFVRVVQWNIEKGRKLDEVLALIESHPALHQADILLLNEADCGMSRSGNRHVARVAAQRLKMNMVFGAAHFELTRGTGEDLAEPGENSDSLQGNAVLSRYPILDASITPLPACFEPYEFVEKRYGARNCVWACLQLPSCRLWAGSVHLEVRNTPECRGKQMHHIMTHLPGGGEGSYLLGGDFNCNTFKRGTLGRTIRSIGRLTLRPCSAVQAELLNPQDREPLFRAARAFGFAWEHLNGREATAVARLEGIEEAGRLPGFLSRWIGRRLAPYHGALHLRLDWLLGKGVRALRKNEIKDGPSGIASVDPGCVPTLRIGPERMSDHGPIYADLRLDG